MEPVGPLPRLRKLGVLPEQAESCGGIALMHDRQRRGLEAGNDGAFRQSATAQQVRQYGRQRGPVRLRCLHLDVEARTAADDVDYLIQAEDTLASVLRRVPATGIQGLEFRERSLSDRPRSVRRAVQIEIVDHHQLAISAELHVQLDHVDANVERAFERRSGVLWSRSGRAAVGDAQPSLAHGRGIEGVRGAVKLIAVRSRECDRKDVRSEWFECTIDVPTEHTEIVANFLIDNGAPGVQSDERDGVVRLMAYFSDAPPVEALVRFCGDIGCPLRDPEGIRVRQIAHEDWGENWKAHFQPQLVGARLFVCPPWDCAAPAGRVAIVIDPGMAFGTGQHASTRGCLLLLEGAIRDGDVTRGLDVGTGSGVLAIALAKLGLADVWAVDTDPVACAIAEANAAANAVEACVHIRPSLDQVSGTFDLLAANLFANLLEELAARLVGLLRPSGVLICAGFLVTDEDRVRSAYESRGLRLDRRHEEQSWVTVALRRPTQP